MDWFLMFDVLMFRVLFFNCCFCCICWKVIFFVYLKLFARLLRPMVTPVSDGLASCCTPKSDGYAIVWCCWKKCNGLWHPRKQAIVRPTLGNGWSCWQHVIVGVLTLAQHWTNTKVITVEVLLLAQRRNFNYAPMVDFELWGQCWPKKHACWQ